MTSEMRYGPVQLLLISFDGNKFSGKILPALQAVRDKNLIRLISLLFIGKDADGNIFELRDTDLTEEQRASLGAAAGSLIGYGYDGSTGAVQGAKAGMDAMALHNFGMSDSDVREVMQSVPPNSSVAIALLEHRWAIDLKEAILDARGSVIAQGLVTPEALVMLGVAMAEDDSFDQTSPL